ncbi:MAG TPA: glycosyltransferase family 39 protein [Blastocatellia bacterium]|nr:glycosyltransferase family 39 protein [Blastocatellia bacterium]
MTDTQTKTRAGGSSEEFEYEAFVTPRASRRRSLLLAAPIILISLIHLLTLVYLARRHPFGNYATETDFYHFYAPDAERLASGQFPQNTFQGPGYPATLALVAKIAGMSGDLFTVGKWMSVVCAVLCGLLVFVLFARLFSYWVGVGAQLIAVASGEFPQFSINAGTDVFFLLLCLAALVVFTGKRLAPGWRVALAGALAGAAYLTRYNGLFLPAACLIGITLLDIFKRRWLGRLALSAIFVALFLAVSSPWLIANYKRQGSPFYNTNYLNVAAEFYPDLVANKTNQDATRALAERFQSFGEVFGYDPMRLITRYPANLYESLRNSSKETLVNQLVAWMAGFGVLLALARRRSKDVALVLIAGALYLLLMALNHWETRYYFLVMVLYAGFAVFAAVAWLEMARSLGWLKNRAFALIPVTMAATMVALSLAESRKDVTRFLDSQPTEIIAARDYLSAVGATGGKRIVARKPHLPYLSRNEWVFFPQVKSLDEFRAWVEANRVDYVAIGKRELKERKELSSLGKPQSAPDWLKAVWINDEPVFILYQPKLINDPGDPATTQ